MVVRSGGPATAIVGPDAAADTRLGWPGTRVSGTPALDGRQPAHDTPASAWRSARTLLHLCRILLVATDQTPSATRPRQLDLRPLTRRRRRHSADLLAVAPGHHPGRNRHRATPRLANSPVASGISPPSPVHPGRTSTRLATRGFGAGLDRGEIGRSPTFRAWPHVSDAGSATCS